MHHTHTHTHHSETERERERDRERERERNGVGFGLGRRYPRSMHDSAHRHGGDLTQFSRGRPAHAEVDLHSLTRRERRMAEARWAGRGASGFSGTEFAEFRSRFDLS